MTVSVTAVNVGTAPADGTGDPARTAFTKLNANDAALATAINGLPTGTTVTANVQSGATYTLQVSDAGQEVQMTNAAANTVYVPSGVFANGTYILVRQKGAGATTITGAGTMNVTPSGQSLTSAQQGALMSIRIDSSTAAYAGGQVALNAPDISVSYSLPTGTVDVTYTGSVTGTNIGGATGTIRYSYDVLPAGLSLDATTGAVTGSPTVDTTTTPVTTTFTITNGAQTKTLAQVFAIQAADTSHVITPSASVSDTTARIAFGPDAAGTVAVKYSANADLSSATTTSGLAVDSSTDFTGSKDITGLSPATTYYYTPVVDGTPQFSSGYPKFTTLPAAGSPAQFSFAFGSCTRHGGSIPTDTIFSKLPPDIAFLMHLGDTIYADSDGTAASTLSDFRLKHRNALAAVDITSVNYKAMRASKPIFTMWDDHDLTNDYSAGKGNALYSPANQAFKEYQGRQNPDSITSGELYYTFQVGDVGFFVPDLRSFRTSNGYADDASKTILGSVQKAALKAWLSTNNSAFKLKIICASVPACGYANTASDSWGGKYDGTQAPNGQNGFRTERNEIWDYIDANQISGVLFISGDQHWAGAFKTTYASRPRYEFMSSSFNSSFLAPLNGMPTDPTNGPVFWTKASAFNAGVLSIDTTVTPATVSFQLYGTGGSLGSSCLTAVDTDAINSGLTPVPSVSLALTLPAGKVGVAYTGSIAATNVNGATGTLTLNSFTLPAGLTLGSPSTAGSTTTWAVTGTPTTDTTTTPVTDTITASNGTQTATSTQVWSIAVATPMTLSGTLPGGTVGVAYSATLTLGGTYTAPVTIDASSGTIPAWMTASVSAGTVTFAGTPTTAETESFTVRATDSSGTPQTAAAVQSVVIAAAVTGDYFDPAHVGTGIALSAGNSVATRTTTSDNTWTSVLGKTPITANLTYFEVRVGTMVNKQTIGIGNASASLASYIGGADGNSVGLHTNGAVFRSAGSTTPVGLPFVSGDVIGVLVDNVGRTVRFNKNNGSMSVTTAITATGSLYAGCSLYQSGAVSTLRVKSSEFTGTIPSGAVSLSGT
jgi:alkaline phosphatase D